jgi:RNA polymerase sigma-70 factor (ECF subfamily)
MTVLQMDFPRALRAAQADAEADDAALRELRRLADPTLQRYLRITAADVADEVASATWLTVRRRLRYFTGGEQAFRTLLVRIAREEVAARRRSVRSDPQAIVDLVRLDARHRRRSRDRATGRPSTERVLRIVATLPPDVAEMLALRVVVGMSATETAGLVATRPGFVIVAVHGGLRRTVGELTARSGHATAMLPNPWELDRLLDGLARHGTADLAVLDPTVRDVVLALRPRDTAIG